MKKKNGHLMIRFFALLICAVLLLGSVPAAATDDPHDETNAPSAVSDGDPTDTPTDGDDAAPADDEDATTADSEDTAPADGEDAAPEDGEDAAPEDGDDVTTEDGEDAAPEDAEALTDPDSEDATQAAEEDAAPEAAPKKKAAKLAKTGAKNEVGTETTEKYEITYTKTASVKTPSTAYSFKGLSKISIRVKDVPDGKAQWVRAIVYDPKNPKPAESITYKSDDWTLPDYVERVIGSDNSVTLNINIGKADESLHFVKDGSKAYSLVFTTAEATEGGLISHGRNFFLDEEGPEIEVKNFDSDKWRTSGFYFGLYVDDNTGIGTDDDGNDLVTASEGTVDEWDDSTFNYMVTLDQRATGDKVTVTAEDELGNKTTKDVTVKVDAENPTLTLTTDSDSYEPKQTFIVTATDADSGIDASSFAFTGGEDKFTVTPVDGKDNRYKVEITADGDLTVDDNAGNTSDALTLTLKKDETAPAATDFSVMFFVKTKDQENAERIADAFLEQFFHVHYDSIYGNDDTLKMRVMVSPNGGSSITSIEAKNNGTAFEAVDESGVQFDDTTKTYYKDFKAPTTDENIYDSVTFRAKDAWDNDSGEIALDATHGIYATVNDPALANILNINDTVSPLTTLSSDGYTAGSEGNETYYAKSGTTLSLNSADAVGHIHSVKAYFDSADKFDETDAPIYGAQIITADLTGLGDDFTVTGGTATYNKADSVTDEVDFTYTVPAGLTSGKYILYVDVQNFAENSTPLSVEIYVDNDAPVISDISYSTVWINTDDTLTFNVAEQPDTDDSGIQSVKVNGTDATLKDGTYQFTMTSRQSYSIVAKDNLGNTATSVVEKSSVMIDKYAPNISDFRYGAAGKTDIKDVDWANATDGIMVAFDIDDVVMNTSDSSFGMTLSGLDVNNVAVTGGEYSDFTYSYNSSSQKYTFSFIAKEFAQYTVTCQDQVTNETKNESTKTTATIKIDASAPDFTAVSFTALRSLSFGLYSNADIAVNAAVEDPSPSSGIGAIRVTVNGTAVDPTGKTYVEGSTDPDTADKTNDNADLTIAKEALSDEDNISFTVTDCVGNSTTKTLKELRKAAQMTANGKAVNTGDVDDGYEIITTDQKPSAEHTVTPDSSNKYYYQDGEKLWLSEMVGANSNSVTNTFTIEDTVAHLHSVTLALNGDDVSAEIVSDYEKNLPSGDSVRSGNTVQYNEIEGVTDHKLDDDTLTFNPKLAEHAGLNKTSADGKGENKVSIEVENNAGNKTTDTATFYIDNTAPIITGITYSGDGRADKPQMIDENGNFVANTARRSADADVSDLKNYGYYFKNNTTLTIKATDLKRLNGSAVDGCGVREIHVFLDPIGKSFLSTGKDYMLTDLTALEGGEVSATFAINANFKGRVYVYAVDNVSNRSDNYHPDGTIVENASNHGKTSSASITVNTAPVAKDNNGNDLFNGNVSVTFVVEDTYMGLYQLTYSVTSKWADDSLGGGTVTIGQTAKSVSGWEILAREANSNLITKVRKTIKLDGFNTHNYNDIVIHVEALDRAGNPIYAKDKTISIDTTKPTIVLTPRDATHNYYDPDGKDYYQETRTFDITVTERNFDPADFEKAALITAREGEAPAIIGSADWSTSYSDYSDSSTHTATISFSTDGDYTVELSYTDEAGNKASSVKSDDFVIDTIDPVLEVSFDNNDAHNGNYYGAARVATVTVTEHNFAEGDAYITYALVAYEGDNTTPKSTPQMATSGWGGSGDSHSTTIDFNEDGNYAFTITYKDKAARNASEYKQETFYIDLGVDKDNAIIFTKGYDQHAFGIEDVMPGVTFFDNNLDASACTTKLTKISYDPKTGSSREIAENLSSDSSATTTTKTERYQNFPDEEINDGIYLYEAKIEDLAGHTATKSIMFSVNRYGATYMCEDEATQQMLNEGFTNGAADVKITEINVTGINDFYVTSTLGTNVATLENTESGDKGFTREQKSGSDSAWYKYEYTIKKGNFEDEGDYTVTLNSTIAYNNDKLNTKMTNLTTRVENRSFPISFVVDKTAPVITINGVAADKAYSEAEKDVKIVCTDNNLDASTLKILLNGKEQSEDSYKATVTDGQVEVELPIKNTEKEQTYSLEVKIGDYAHNNAENNDTKNFILSATWLTMFLRNTLALVLTSVGVAAAIAVVVLLILRRRRRQ